MVTLLFYTSWLVQDEVLHLWELPRLWCLKELGLNPDCHLVIMLIIIIPGSVFKYIMELVVLHKVVIDLNEIMNVTG